MTVRHGNIQIQVPHPVWMSRLNLYPRYDPRYRLLLHFYLKALPVSPEAEKLKNHTSGTKTKALRPLKRRPVMPELSESIEA